MWASGWFAAIAAVGEIQLNDRFRKHDGHPVLSDLGAQTLLHCLCQVILSPFIGAPLK
jgi:hypothetical protein